MANKKRGKRGKTICYDGLVFDSILEFKCYLVLLLFGVQPKREPYTYLLWKGFTPSVTFCKAENPTYRAKHPDKPTLMYLNTKMQDITYTPDFEFDYVVNDQLKHIIIEVKGQPTNEFKLKFKMFRKLVERFEDAKDYMIVYLHDAKALGKFLISITPKLKAMKLTFSDNELSCLGDKRQEFDSYLEKGECKNALLLVRKLQKQHSKKLREENIDPWTDDMYNQLLGVSSKIDAYLIILDLKYGEDEEEEFM